MIAESGYEERVILSALLGLDTNSLNALKTIVPGHDRHSPLPLSVGR